jgi:hypothetical protein
MCGVKTKTRQMEGPGMDTEEDKDPKDEDSTLTGHRIRC